MSKRRRWSRKPKAAKLPETRTEGRRVAVLVPAGDMCHTQFAMCLTHMISSTYQNLPDNLDALTVNSYGTSILPFSRQILAKQALEQDVTHMLWIDSDMEFPSDMLLSFLRHDHPIVGINAMSRRSPYNNTAQSAPNEQLMTTPDSTGLEKVHRCGFGVLWHAAEVIQKMELPWFSFDWMPDLSVFRGEDYGFLEKAKALGYEIYIDHDISKRVNHTGCFGFNPVMKAILGEMSVKPSAPVDKEPEERAA